MGDVRRAAAAQPGRTCTRSSSASPRQQVRGRRAPTSRSSATSTAPAWTRRPSRPRESRRSSPSSRRSTRSTTSPSLRAEIGRLQSIGVNALFAFGSEEDREDSSSVIAAAVQAGLGLPDRDYYTEDRRQVRQAARAVRRARGEDARARGRAGGQGGGRREDDPGARDEARRRRRRTKVDFRDPDKTHHPMTLAAFSKATPNLAVDDLLRRPEGSAGHLDQRLAAGLLPGREQDGRVRAARGLEDVSALAAPDRRRRADSSEEVRGRELRVLRQDARRHARAPAALEAVRDRDRQRDGHGPRPHLRRRSTSRPRPRSAPTSSSRTCCSR